MYDELVKRLREDAPRALSNFDFDFVEDWIKVEGLIKEAADAIEKLGNWWAQADKLIQMLDMPRWIPVTELLPECDLGAEVGNIEWISNGMVHAGCFGRGGKYRDAYFRTWTDAGEGMDAKDADYWRAVTLPEPPKEENND